MRWNILEVMSSTLTNDTAEYGPTQSTMWHMPLSPVINDIGCVAGNITCQVGIK